MARKYHELDHDDRKEIERMLAENMSIREIAIALGAHRSTIYREISRGYDEMADRYSAEIAEQFREN